MRKVFVDTSFWFALVCRSDEHHDEARELLGRIEGKALLVTSNFILDESLTLIARKLGFEVARSFKEALDQSQIVEVVRVTEEDEEKAWELFEQHAPSGASFTDCTSFALMERLGISEALAFDEDFERAGFKCLRPRDVE